MPKLDLPLIPISVPVSEHGEGTVSLDYSAHHADFLWPEELQRQCLPRDQHDWCVRQHWDGLATIVIMHCTTVELLHVCAQVLEDPGRWGTDILTVQQEVTSGDLFN